MNHLFNNFPLTFTYHFRDLKDHHQLVKSLTHKNKVLTQERRDLENQVI